MITLHKKNEKIVKKVFEDVSDKYDIMNDIMSLGIHRVWKKEFINWLNPQKNTKLIDVASGTGDIAKLFAKAINNESEICCVDENKDMLEISKNKLKNVKNIKWCRGNAENLQFENDSFDYYTISFGIRNIINLEKALEEALRVLKPGGRFLCLEFSKPENEIVEKFYKIYSKSIPKIGQLVVGKSEPYKYLINSIKEFYSQNELLEIIKRHKFINTSYRNLSGGIVAIHSAWKV